MFEKIAAFFMSIIAFFMQLFGLSSSDTIVLKNVSYGDADRQVVDIYLPSDAEEPVGLVVFIHGGGWIAGDKASFASACENLSENYGLAAATLNYRYLSDAVNCNDMLSDIDAAVSKICSKAAENGVQIKSTAFGGHSAGGHLALMYSYTYADKSAVPVAFCIDQSGPSDLTDPDFYTTSNVLGLKFMTNVCSWLTDVAVTEENYNTPEVLEALSSVSPVSYVSPSSVPTIICHGDIDDTVPYSNSLRLDAALTNAGVEHKFITYTNSGHNLDNDDAANKAFEAAFLEYIELYF